MKKFIRFNYELYKDNQYSVPDIYEDMLETFSDKNAAMEFCEAIYFLAYKDGKVVGRVAGIINNKANKTWNLNAVRFGWIDFIDDIEVSSALLDAVIAFGKSRGMTQIVGPLGFTDFDPEGMLVEGFDRISTMAVRITKEARGLELGYALLGNHFEAFINQSSVSCIFRRGDMRNSKHHQQMVALLEETANLQRFPSDVRELTIKGKLYTISALLLQMIRSKQDTDIQIKDLSDVKKIDHALEIIHNQYPDPLTVDTTSRLCGYSKSNFCNCWRKKLCKYC